VANDKIISGNDGGVDIKSLEEVSVNIIAQSFLNCSSSNAEDGRQGILWDDSEQSGDGASSSENESATEGSLSKLSD
jgi:hypothetical protein